ncbi:hypothetical protein [Rhodococcoides yunnanense]|uniref:hypothetical protein n=1 Tax=Rhodococcoides yunnanense TaxID=278209 RepID=UPI000933E189|nr:hypothetical protein [Rhodococcus yunnanensis]
MNLDDITVENSASVPYVSPSARAREATAASNPHVINRDAHLDRLADQQADAEAEERAIDEIRQQKEIP